MARGRVSVPAIIAIVVVVATVVGALRMVGGPGIERQRRFDEQRERDLDQITQAVNAYWHRHSALPQSLDSLVSDHLLTGLPRDPVANTVYMFSVTGPRAYHVCAIWEQPAEGREAVQPVYDQRAWVQHGSGPACYDLTPPEGR